MESLKDKITKEMVVDYKIVLEKDFDIVKNIIRIMPNGKVDILSRDKLTGKDQILLYLIGKLYSKEGGYSETENVTNKELMEELRIPRGSILPWVKDLRDANKIIQVDPSTHTIPLNLVDDILKKIAEKVGVK